MNTAHPDRQPGNNLDPWYSQYAERTAGLTVSEVRALFAVASRPEVVSLAGGMPGPAAARGSGRDTSRSREQPFLNAQRAGSR